MLSDISMTSFISDAAHDGKETLYFLGGENGRGFVHDQNVDPAKKHPQDFHPLLFSHRQLPDVCPTVDGQTVLV